MNKTLLIILAVIIGGLVLWSIPSDTDDHYADTVLAERKEKDTFMNEDKNSPFLGMTDSIVALKYFPPDPHYRVIADLETIEEKKVVQLTTSTGATVQYLEFAWAIFDLDGTTYRLLIFEVMDMGPTRGQLFLAFADATSAGETYGAGRYLDLKKVRAATTIELDFNKAYNPYCAYNDQYSCPLPPRENLLPIPIPAGEKAFH